MERNESFLPIISSIKKYFCNPLNVKILNPGCGLNWLNYELANLGYNTTGIEFSYSMILIS
jgi:hypothetical protein